MTADSSVPSKGPKIRVQTDSGKALHVHIPQALSWVLSICATLVVGLTVWVATSIVELKETTTSIDTRVGYIERTRFETTDALQLMQDMVPRAEYDAAFTALNARLDRMENKLDRALEGR